MTEGKLRREYRLANRIEAVTGIRRNFDPNLFKVARLRAREKPIGHVSPLLDAIAADGVGWGEVLGYNRFWAHPVAQVVDAWMHSESHRKVIMDKSYPVIGCGVYVEWWSGRWYYCAIVTTRFLP